MCIMTSGSPTAIIALCVIDPVQTFFQCFLDLWTRNKTADSFALIAAVNSEDRLHDTNMMRCRVTATAHYLLFRFIVAEGSDKDGYSADAEYGQRRQPIFLQI